MTTVTKSKEMTYVNAYLILKNTNNEVLLHLRDNTGYLDGMYGLVSGHVESEESALDAMVREAKEEAGITIEKQYLECVHALHRKSNRLNLDLFFLCTKWEGEITNVEPHKCKELVFASFTNLPKNTIPYVSDVLMMVNNGIFYSDGGF